MKSILEEIYYGEKGFYEKIKPSEGYLKVHKEYCQIHDKLEEGLNDEQKKILDDLFIATCGLEDKIACTHFIEGFKIGLLVAVETFG